MSDAEWSQRTLGQCLLSSPSYGINAPAVPSEPTLPTYLRITDINQDGRLNGDTRVSVAAPGSDAYKLAAGDLVFARTGASVGKSYLYSTADGELVFAGFLIKVQPDPRVVLPAFLAQYCRSHMYWTWVQTTSMRSGQPGINGQEYASLPLRLPPIEEQQAIVEALSGADALVESLDALIAKKRDMRQSTMQRFMLPSPLLPGATIRKLGDVLQVRKGELITESTAMPGDVPVIAGGKDAAYYSGRWNRVGLTITISASGANAGYVKLRNGRLWASDCSTISESPEYDIRFVAAQLEVRQARLYQSQFGGAQPHVRPNDISAIDVCWADVAQQRLIGEVMAGMDAEIEALISQREKAGLVKQGMMQELLSGRVRLV